MAENQTNQYQISRKDARNCFVESLSDMFAYEKVHFNFATYDLNLPAGKRQTNQISIYIATDEFLELCRKLECGELKFMMQNKKKNGDSSPLYESLGGTSAEKLRSINRARADGKCLSRTVKLISGEKSDFLFIADSGPGEQNSKGLIVPKFGSKPENHVAVSMTFETLSELLLLTKVHYMAWRTAWYQSRFEKNKNAQNTAKNTENNQTFFST